MLGHISEGIEIPRRDVYLHFSRRPAKRAVGGQDKVTFFFFDRPGIRLAVEQNDPFQTISPYMLLQRFQVADGRSHVLRTEHGVARDDDVRARVFDAADVFFGDAAVDLDVLFDTLRVKNAPRFFHFGQDMLDKALPAEAGNTLMMSSVSHMSRQSYTSFSDVSGLMTTPQCAPQFLMSRKTFFRSSPHASRCTVMVLAPASANRRT